MCKETSLGLAYSSHNARKKLLTTCQHWKHNITCLSDWPIYRCHSQLRQSSCPNFSCDQFSQSCSAAGKIAPGVYILPHKAKQEKLNCYVWQFLTPPATKEATYSQWLCMEMNIVYRNKQRKLLVICSCYVQC